MKRAEQNIIDLCSEIDMLRAEVNYWQDLYTKERDENMKQMNDRLEESKKMIGNVLMFAMAVKDDENGNLIISNEDRIELAERYKD